MIESVHTDTDKRGKQMTRLIDLFTQRWFAASKPILAAAKSKRGSLASTLLLATLVLPLVLPLAGCGSSITPRPVSSTSTDLSSTSPEGKLGADCNVFDASGARLAGKVTSYYQNGNLVADRVRLRFTSLAQEFEDGSNRIQFFRWRASDLGETEIDSDPVGFTIDLASTGQPLTTTIYEITAEKIAELRKTTYIPGTTATDFFAQTVVNIAGVDWSWHALKAVMYSGPTVQTQVDFLIPIFAADPNAYAADHPDVLNRLHPFWSQRSQSLSESDWQARSEAYCF